MRFAHFELDVVVSYIPYSHKVFLVLSNGNALRAFRYYNWIVLVFSFTFHTHLKCCSTLMTEMRSAHFDTSGLVCVVIVSEFVG